MGCGSSQPATVNGAPPQAGQPKTSPFSAASSGQRVSGNVAQQGPTNGAADELQAENGHSTGLGAITPTHSKPATKERPVRSRRVSVEGSCELPEQIDYGPTRDFEGLKLVKADNDRLTHIVTLAMSILKASLCYVVLGQKDKMVLAKASGVEEDDDKWLPAACAWSLSQETGLLVIENMITDERTTTLSWVRKDPGVGFYAGTPICTPDGKRLGCLVVLDFEPRVGLGMMCESLKNLAEMVAREVQAEEQMNSGEALLNRAIDTYWDACCYIDTSFDKWKIKYCNDAFIQLTDLARDAVLGMGLWDIVELTGSVTSPSAHGRLQEVLKRQMTHDIQPVIFLMGKQSTERSKASRKVTFKLNMRPMRPMHITNYSLPFGEEESKQLWFAVISTFQLNDSSRGGLASLIEMDVSLIPFENVELGPLIGKGSFGSVFKATWSGRIVAIKIIPFSEIAKVDATGNPLEASLMLDLKHPNIVETYKHALQSAIKAPEEDTSSEVNAKHTSAGSNTSGTGNLQFWLMLEFCDVGTLSDGLEMGLLHDNLNDGSGNLFVPKVTFVLETLRDIARGMEFVHSYNILHSDLTAGNVLLDSTEAGVQGNRNFVAKIADFGLSRQALTTRVETNTYGTVTHMPPELLNEGLVSKAADVYAFGVLVYEVYTKQPVWKGLRHPQIIHAIAVQKKHPELPESAPHAIRDLAHSCMGADPKFRPTFTEIIGKLDKMLEPIIKAAAS